VNFSIACPVDGQIEVALEDIDTVVLRAPGQAEVIFSCPRCGLGVSVLVQIPGFLMTTIDGMAFDTDRNPGSLASIVALVGAEVDDAGLGSTPPDLPLKDTGEHIEAYCEYFRRQLTEVDDVKDILREFDMVE